MSGIVFFATQQHDAVVEFYTNRVGADVWLEQPGCTILDFDGFRFGFCDRDYTDDCGILTFVYESRTAVDEMHDALNDVARDEPHENDTYHIYQFFADDPDGRAAEFQMFLD
ncbi:MULTISPECIES: VOC family protein [Haloferax]|uniref:VOC family protein n=2 Tax=Haloferax TaxID=2251 RepID=A0A6G1Z573_9EURY|nr:MULTISPECIES: VOC family protein [Haloferax]KAB1188985.1 VOC family protein [Haloferax sp. CBA1149]MRW81709.1 VOC family protein [Haloferax marinisediminis]